MGDIKDGWRVGEEGAGVSGGIKESTFKTLMDSGWESHPLVKDILLNLIVAKEDNDAGVSCFFVKIPKGQEIPVHFHDFSNDIIVPLAGKGKIWIKGIGESALHEGVVVNVPKGTPHRVFDVTEDFFAFDVFCPGIK
ncbi:cupin domain-containing protein [Thermodesulfobacteriota bacterium]